MLKKVAIGLVVVVLALCAFIATRPSTFHVERRVTIAAPAQAAFQLVNDFHLWVQWSPWEKLDPGMKKTHEGPGAGVGARYAWVGNREVGEGRMTLTESMPFERIAIRLEFIKPFAATNQTVFTFAPAPGGVVLTWAMDGPQNFMSRAFSLFVNMDTMIGKDFEKGLAALKNVAEKHSAI